MSDDSGNLTSDLNARRGGDRAAANNPGQSSFRSGYLIFGPRSTYMTAVEARSFLCNNVDALGTAGEDTTFGLGRINAGKAVADAYRTYNATSLPFSDNFDGGSLAINKWCYQDTGVSASTGGVAEPSGTFSANINTADRLESNAINLAGNSGVIQFNFATEARGPASGEQLFVEYLNSSNAWENLATYTSTGASENVFTSRSLVIPNTAAARHAKFAVRFRAAGNATLDNWYIDNVFIGTPGCDADFNGDTTVDFFDYLDFVAAFSTGSGTADFQSVSELLLRGIFLILLQLPQSFSEFMATALHLRPVCCNV